METIRLHNLTKIYPLKGRAPRRGGPFSHGKPLCKTALEDVSLRVEAGETVGVLGRNGSGKSTLLKLISGVTTPTSGQAEVRGRLAALLELGAGFHPEYTGVQNLYFNGAIQGLTRKEVSRRLPEILDFAGIGDYAAQPVKTYSDGMFVRLAFAAAVCGRPDILLVDEALAVGDLPFQAKCFRRLGELQAAGVTTLYVTHDVDRVRRLCTRAVWLEEGRLRMDGPVGRVTSAYMEAAVAGTGTAPPTAGLLNRFGSHVGAVRQVEAPPVWPWGAKLTVRVRVQVPPEAPATDLALSLAVRNQEGLDLLVLSTLDGGAALLPGRAQTVTFRFQNLLCPGRYALAVALERRDTRPISYYDYCEGIAWPEAVAATPEFGVFHTPAEVEIHEEATP